MPKVRVNSGPITTARLSTRRRASQVEDKGPYSPYSIATSDDPLAEGKPRFSLPDKGCKVRNGLYANGRKPSDDEKWDAFEQIVGMAECAGYTRKNHSNWCSQIERHRMDSQRRYIVENLLQTPNPTLTDVMLWGRRAGLSRKDVFRIVEEEVPDDVEDLVESEFSLSFFDPSTSSA